MIKAWKFHVLSINRRWANWPTVTRSRSAHAYARAQKYRIKNAAGHPGRQPLTYTPPPPRLCLSTGWALIRCFQDFLRPLFLWCRM